MEATGGTRGVTAISTSALKKVFPPPAGSDRSKRKSFGPPVVAQDWPEDEVVFA
ncbi:hypothetical protein C7212DRAFT_318692 [Tuber magnatum]|uniref:Uncharacterized protein n=1 Tax=Tuber magnatum TaxID=42249 RepID=A0A317SQX6_9PEZI|nr:hypothetical protein C7212DRAFT_318692 [Tuber magnatum]